MLQTADKYLDLINKMQVKLFLVIYKNKVIKFHFPHKGGTVYIKITQILTSLGIALVIRMYIIF